MNRDDPRPLADGLAPLRLARGCFLFARDQSVDDAWETHALLLWELVAVDPDGGNCRAAQVKHSKASLN